MLCLEAQMLRSREEYIYVLYDYADYGHKIYTPWG